MHKILIEEGHKPTIKRQKRLNLNMQEMVKKEVVKLVDVEVIYVISGNLWVSPIQCIPNKGGITIVENEKGKKIPIIMVNG